ncbi:hypothetical protein HNY73_013443 [Argiope bruennichi]|uniref:Uncharacterized protein n=1 Tax=Argiope bruennichi TaxID=94029 RepID=A0A8T0EY17_ARGBR|nr:hypothetical protein HNY73_013443 [Argiope bruennichi]
MYKCYESFRTSKVGRTSTNIFLQLKWDLTDYENHRFNVRTAKPCIDTGAPLTYSHLYYRPKKLQLELERFCTIQRHNKYLLERVARIQREGAWVDNKNYHEIKSLNIWKRQKEMIELAYNNQTMLNRLLDCTTYYNRSKLEDQYLYKPGLERKKNKWALEKEAFEIVKAQEAAEKAKDTEEKKRLDLEKRLEAAEKLRKHKKDYLEASKKWREAREERLRQAKQHEQEAKERESEGRYVASEKLRQRREKAKRELELRRQMKAREAELEALEKKKREFKESQRESEKLRQRKEKAKKELEEWKNQKKAREAEREALEKKEKELISRTTRRKLLGQRKTRQPISGMKKPGSKEDKDHHLRNEIGKRSRDIRQSIDDKRRQALERKMKGTDSDSYDLTDDDTLQVPEAREKGIIEEIMEELKSETERHELTDRDSSQTSDTRLDKAEKSREMSDNNGEESKEKKDDKKDEEEADDANSNETGGKKRVDDKKSSKDDKGSLVKDEEKPEALSDEEREEDLGKAHIITEEGEVEEMHLGVLKAESEREALHDLADEDENVPKDLGTAHIVTDEGKPEKVQLVEVKDESEADALRDPTDLEPSQETAEDVKALGSAYTLTDKGTLEEIDLEKLKDETQQEDLEEETEEQEKEKDEKEEIKPQGSSSRTIHVFGERGSVEEIKLKDVTEKKPQKKRKE